MKPTLLLLLLAFALGAAPLAAQTDSSQHSVMTAPSVPPEPAFLTPADEECEALCFQEYIECSNGCAACDQCSCQLALCRAGCGVPYTGC